MEDISLHILDIAENAVAAGARTLSIEVTEDTASDLLALEIGDDGAGMDAGDAGRAADPFYTTRTTRRVGLGLALLREAATEAGGTMTIRSAPGAGTSVRASFRLSHIDRKPLGDMAATISTLVASCAEMRIRYRHTRDGRSYVFDTREVLDAAGGAHLDTGDGLAVIRDYLRREEDALAHHVGG